MTDVYLVHFAPPHAGAPRRAAFEAESIDNALAKFRFWAGGEDRVLRIETAGPLQEVDPYA